jgi:Holin of 3TMs, for gene-transfer release
MNPLIASMLGPLVDLIGRFFPDPKEKAAAQLQVMQMAQNGELAQLNAALQVILAEANGNWLQRSWRPLMMLFFAGLVGARWFGYSAPNMSEAEILELWNIVKIGIGGYTIGRSVEKVAPALAEAIKR